MFNKYGNTHTVQLQIVHSRISGPFFLGKRTGTTKTVLKGTALLIKIFLFQTSILIFHLRTSIFQWKIQCHIPYN
jgi:hypothetical protein